MIEQKSDKKGIARSFTKNTFNAKAKSWGFHMESIEVFYKNNKYEKN